MKEDIEVLEIDDFIEPDTSLLELDKEIKEKRKKKKIIKVLIIVLIVILLILFIFYGPFKGLKNYIIDNNTSLAGILYGTNAVNERLDKNYVKEPTESTNPDLITINKKNKKTKIILINEGKQTGYLVEVYNASKISLGKAKKLSINAKSTQNNSVQGILIQDNKLIFDNAPANVAGGMIGFDNDNKLILKKDITDYSNIKNAITYGPYLIINGKKTIISGNGGFKKGVKSSIGQRKDGMVLFLYLDNATLTDSINILQKYGAYNAANLPVGESSITIKNGKIGYKKVNNDISFVIE